MLPVIVNRNSRLNWFKCFGRLILKTHGGYLFWHLSSCWKKLDEKGEVFSFPEFSREPMLEMFIFETSQLLEQLEQILINSEKSNGYSSQDIHEIFRIMHTIKGSSAMMLYNNISEMAHTMEDLFHFIRENKPSVFDYSALTDLVLRCADYMRCADYIKTELAEIETGKTANTDGRELYEEIDSFLNRLRSENALPQKEKQKERKTSSDANQKYFVAPENKTEKSFQNTFKAVLFFDEGCQMENIRAYGVIHNLKDVVSEMQYFPPNITSDDGTDVIIRKDGFKILMKTECSIETIRELLLQTVFLKSLTLEEMDEESEALISEKQSRIIQEEPVLKKEKQEDKQNENEAQVKSLQQNMISVSIAKLDKLMDLVGELVISEAMVTQNSDLAGLSLDNFHKAARQLKKISGELQDIVMSIRMVPLAATFHKMNRIVRDMSKKLNRKVHLEIIGEETEVDKNIIEHISDPIMHLIRNAVDHGIEPEAERLAMGKSEHGNITLEAKNSGGDVLIIVKDDGRGLNREKIIEKARANGLLTGSADELSNREVFSFIFLPGFSTKENVSEFSGRGVGMDVVTKNIEKIGGTVSVDSVPSQGTTITIKVPLTLAIIAGMNIRVGKSIYTIPTIAIRECFRPGENDVFSDPDGREMIMIRGQCYPILRLHSFFKVKTDVVHMHQGIIIVVENNNESVCLFADELLGEQQVVVKALPNYIRKVQGLAGCTLLGNGTISLILDVAQFMGNVQ